jgi:hypothetical protein
MDLHSLYDRQSESIPRFVHHRGQPLARLLSVISGTAAFLIDFKGGECQYHDA